MTSRTRGIDRLTPRGRGLTVAAARIAAVLVSLWQCLDYLDGRDISLVQILLTGCLVAFVYAVPLEHPQEKQ